MPLSVSACVWMVAVDEQVAPQQVVWMLVWIGDGWLVVQSTLSGQAGSKMLFKCSSIHLSNNIMEYKVVENGKNQSTRAFVALCQPANELATCPGGTLPFAEWQVGGLQTPSDSYWMDGWVNIYIYQYISSVSHLFSMSLSIELLE